MHVSYYVPYVYVFRPVCCLNAKSEWSTWCLSAGIYQKTTLSQIVVGVHAEGRTHLVEGERERAVKRIRFLPIAV